MDGLREYVIRVVAAALISGVVIRLTEGIGSGEIIRMLCGLFMTLILLQPIIGRRELQWEFMLPQIRRQAEENVLEGVAAAEKIRQEFIMRKHISQTEPQRWTQRYRQRSCWEKITFRNLWCLQVRYLP